MVPISSFKKKKALLIFFQITSKNEGLSDVNRVYTSAYTLKSPPLLGSDFCIQIMESYLDKVLEMIKRGQIHIYTLEESRSRCQLTHLCTFWEGAEDRHVHFIRTFEEFATFCCGHVFMATLEIKKKRTSTTFWCSVLDTLTSITM